MKSNPAKYRELSVPFPSSLDAEKALEAFWSDVEAARDAHRIADVIVTVGVSYLRDGEESIVSTHAQYGNVSSHESLVAMTLGNIQAERQAAIGKLLATAVRKGAREF